MKGRVHFVGGVAVQVQWNSAPDLRKASPRTAFSRRASPLLVFEIVALGRIPGGVVHVFGIHRAQPPMEVVAVGILQGGNDEMGARPLGQPPGRPQSPGDARWSRWRAGRRL